MALTIIALLCALPLSQASFSFGGCPKIDYVSDLDLEQFSGTWYNIVEDKDTASSSKKATCSQFEITKPETDSLYYKIAFAEVVDGKWKMSYLNGKTNKKGELRVKHSSIGATNYKIVSVDYKKYAIMHTCYSYFLFHWSYNWLLARKTNYKVTQAQIDTFGTLGTKPDDLVYASHNSCPPLPDPK